MKRKTNILLFILIIFTLSLLFIPLGKSSIADIHYSFDNDIIYNNDNIFYNDSYNLGNITSYTQEYYGSYSFTNETDGVSGIDIGFIDVDNSDADCIGQINTSQFSHDKVLEMYDNNAVGNVDLFDTLESNQDLGIVEFWIMTSNAGLLSAVRSYDGGTRAWYFAIDIDKFRYYDGGWNDIGKVALDNTWYHIKVIFECTGSTFEGLAQYDWKVFINGVEYGDFNFENNRPHIDQINLITDTPDVNYYSYYDAFGYSWLSNYTIKDNELPISITDTSLKQVNRYEFALKDINTFHTFLDDDLNGWTDIEVGGGDNVGSVDEVDGSYDRLISVSDNALGSVRGIEKNDFLINGTFVNITLGIIFMVMDGLTNRVNLDIYASDDFPVVRIITKADNSIWMTSGVGGEIDTGIVIQTALPNRYEYNIFIDYEIDRYFLRVIENNILIGKFDVDVRNTGKEGLGKIDIKNIVIDDLALLFTFIDYVGVYDSNGISAVESGIDFGILEFNLLNDWNFEHNNLLEITGNGTFHLGAVSNAYTDSSAMTEIDVMSNYNNVLLLKNVYDGFIANINSASLIITVIERYFNISYLNIEGVQLTQGLNEYPLEYSHSGININESYFYVDVNNKLQFTHTANDTDTEYIQATFNISDLSSTDRAISFKGVIINNAYGYFVVDYLVGLSTNIIPILEKTTRAILPTNKTIDTFIVLITDNDVDSVLGTTLGYVSEVKLLSISAIGLPIITAGLIEMMIPLIMIMIPTLLISQGFGKEGKKLIIPLFFIFSLITTATLIIPVWIFFIILFGTGLFLARNKEIEVK